MDPNTVILVTGLVTPVYINDIIESHKNIDNKIISIWENTLPRHIEMLQANNFNVYLNKMEEEKTSNNLQLVPIVNGLLYAQKLGYKYVLRTRTDVFSTDYKKYLEKTEHLYKEKITAFCGIETDVIYFLQICESGNINDMLKMYTLQTGNDRRFTEKFLLENYCNKTNLTRDDIRKNMHFSIDICRQNNIEFYWYRDKRWHIYNRSNPYMKVVSEYSYEYTMWT